VFDELVTFRFGKGAAQRSNRNPLSLASLGSSENMPLRGMCIPRMLLTTPVAFIRAIL
jgi:hypothetical protein